MKALTVGDQQQAYMKLVRSQDPRVINVWKFHGERKPCKVVSLRAAEGFYGSKGPRIGSRLAVQAVVRFDTLQVCLAPGLVSDSTYNLTRQSVEMYSKRTGARIGATEPKTVTEYLVFQKRMWFDSPWVIRDRLFEG